MNEKSPFRLPPIEAVTDAVLAARLQHKIDQKTKPQGALGRLEDLALQLGLIQRRESPSLRKPQMVVFAADLPWNAQLLPRKIAHGSKNICTEPAMSRDQAEAALAAGMVVMQSLPGNVVAFGEMGIANTSPAALLLVRLAGTSIADATGRGTGLDERQLHHKQDVLTRALARHPASAPLDVVAELAALGGFEIAMMAGAMLQAASQRRVVLVDGFIAGAAALVACVLAPPVRDYLVFCHRSAETGHRLLLNHLGARPLLELDLRLGEGTGALLSWPLVQSAAGFLNGMASFESAGVSQK